MQTRHRLCGAIKHHHHRVRGIKKKNHERSSYYHRYFIKMTESAVTHTGEKRRRSHVLLFVVRFSLFRRHPQTKCCVLALLSLFLLRETLRALFFFSLTLSSSSPPSQSMRVGFLKATTVSKTDGFLKYPRRCGRDKRIRWKFARNCTTNGASFNTCKCSKRPRTGIYSCWTGAYKRRNGTSSRTKK